jgi:hypothetical protein
MSGDASFLAALVSSLQADATLVGLTGHTTTSPKIFRSLPPKGGTLPALAVTLLISRPLIKDHTFVKRYVVSLAACASKEITAINIADRAEALMHGTLQGDVSAFYDFSNVNISVYSTLWKSRLQSSFDEDLDYFKDENIIEIISNPFQGCS